VPGPRIVYGSAGEAAKTTEIMEMAIASLIRAPCPPLKFERSHSTTSLRSPRMAAFCMSEDDNADLFWAVRGGGGNFGVAASFEFVSIQSDR
jgi:hypothetical protein